MRDYTVKSIALRRDIHFLAHFELRSRSKAFALKNLFEIKPAHRHNQRSLKFCIRNSGS